MPRPGRSPSGLGSQQSQHMHHQQQPSSHGHGGGAGPRPSLPPPAFICCNRCRKPLTTTLYLLSCDCVLCEGCTFSHFDTSANCPNCGKTLGENDLMELVVADPSKSQQEYSKNFLQTMFTKRVSNKQALTFSDMCSRMMRNFEDNRRAMQFLLKQLIHETSSSQTRSLDAQLTNQQIKEEFTQFKQSSAAAKVQFEQTIENLQNKLKALMVELTEQKSQNQQLRTMAVQNASTRQSPSSSHSQGSGGGGKRLPSNSSQNMQRSPLGGFVINTQGHPQQQGQVHGAMHMNRPMMQHSRPSTSSRIEPLITPIQAHPSTSSFRSQGGFQGGVAGSASTFTSSAGYLFSSHGGTKNGKRYHDENAMPNLHAPPPPSQYQRTQHHPSPNMAFAYNTTGGSGGGSTSSSRASSFQFHPYNQGGVSNESYAPSAPAQYHRR